MKPISQLSVEELAALVCQTLARAGVPVTLTGGACVQIWSEGKYVSYDLDFIEEGLFPRRQLRDALAALGFVERNRYFAHPKTRWVVEFPTGPLMVGDERVVRTAERRTPLGTLRLLTPTDCVKDRLAAFYHWNDRQALEQAILVARAQSVDLDDIRRWSRAEGADAKFRVFRERLAKPDQ